MAKKYDKSKTREISVKLSRRVSKNYQSMEIGIEQMLLLDEDDDVMDIREAVLEDLVNFVDEALEQIPVDPFEE